MSYYNNWKGFYRAPFKEKVNVDANVEVNADEEGVKERHINEITKLLEYAKSNYGYKFEKKFVNHLYDISGKSKKIPKDYIIDAIMAEWKLWEPYVEPESFQGFITDGIESFFKIHCTATFKSSDLNGYIGNKAIVKSLPDFRSTSITMRGTLKIDGVSVNSTQVIKNKKDS